MSKNQGKIIVIVAPSGTGKSTLIKLVKEDFPNLKESVSCTTRPPRSGELHGVHYFFLSEDEFLQKKVQGDFLEWAIVHGNYYGTSKSFVIQNLNQGHDLLFDIDVQGADSFKEHFQGQANIIFIEPPSIDELKKRLYARATDPEEVIKRRLKNAESELKKRYDYNYCVKNDDILRARQELQGIITDILR